MKPHQINKVVLNECSNDLPLLCDTVLVIDTDGQLSENFLIVIECLGANVSA